jgi:hypothetical protein
MFDVAQNLIWVVHANHIHNMLFDDFWHFSSPLEEKKLNGGVGLQ